MNRMKLLLAASVLALPGCASTSFAPPNVDVTLTTVRQNLSRDCHPSSSQAITPGVDGALTLIDTFLASYRCTLRVAADGRQAFQLPSFLALVGATTATALGAGANVAIVGGATSQVFTAGNNYYSPAQQGEILRDAVDALTCIQAEAVGIDAFSSIRPAATRQQQLLEALGNAGGGQVEITAERQYFNVVASALFTVENVAADRLGRRGSINAADVAAQIEALAQQVRDAQKKADNPNPPEPSAALVTAMNGNREAARLMQQIQVNIDLLRPKLQQCILRAKV